MSHHPPPTSTAPSSTSWLRNLQRSGGGFWRDADWYDLHLSKRMPHYEEMIQRLVLSLPPLPAGSRCLDFLGGSGLASVECASAYPSAHWSVLDSDSARLSRARARFKKVGLSQHHTLVQKVEPELSAVAGAEEKGYDLIIAVLALHHLLEHDHSLSQADLLSTRFLSYLHLLKRSLTPDGHLFIGDHVGVLPLFTQMPLLQQAGFVDIDVSWRVDDMFVLGARRPSEEQQHKEGEEGEKNKTIESVQKSVAAATPAIPAPAAVTAASPSPATHASASAAAPSSSSSSTPASVPHSFPPTSHTPVAAPAAAPAAPSSSSSSSLSPALLSKLPLLFHRFDPARTGRLSYSALQSLCRSVGRDPETDVDGEENLWWTYQSYADTDQDSGVQGLTIEDLTAQFYQSGMWPLEDDLRKLRIIP